MNPYSVQFTAVAERHLSAIDEWWQANRPAVPGLFKREVAEATQQLVQVPHRRAGHGDNPRRLARGAWTAAPLAMTHVVTAL